MADTITLYRGNNGAHEFYENDHGYLFTDGSEAPVLVLRNHGDERWTAMVDWHVLPGSQEHPEGWMRELARETGKRIEVRGDREWRYETASDGHRMQLVEV